MNRASNVRTRIGVLIGAVALLAIGSVPLMGTAQDATPSGSLSEAQLIEEGEKIYNNVCIACHQPDGQGIEGIFLPLDGNPLVTLEDPEVVITTILNGRGGMPRFDTTYDDEEIAAIVTYIRQEWSNDAPPVSADEVAEVREGLEMTTPTPQGQVPEGPFPGSTPDAGTPIVAEPEDAPEGTPEATP